MATKAVKRVLVIEDAREFQQLFTDEIGDTVELLHARTQKEATKMFLENSRIALIVLDGLVPKEEGDHEYLTTNLAERFRMSGFTGKMLAYSSSHEINADLMERGCTGIVPNKLAGPAAVLHELGIS